VKLDLGEHDLERLKKAARPNYAQVNGAKSGRPWKLPATAAATFMKPQTSRGITSWETRMATKAKKKARLSRVYEHECSPRHSPRGVPVVSTHTCFKAQCTTGAPQVILKGLVVILHVAYRCSPRAHHSQHSVLPVPSTSF
jgi:hypothetical protein